MRGSGHAKVMPVSTATLSDAAAQAAAAAGVAAADAGVELSEIAEVIQLDEVVDLFAATWETPRASFQIGSELLRALTHAGNYVAGARSADGTLVGASMAFFGVHRGHRDLHSHITGVRPDGQGRHVGFALKQHQRAWALSRGIDLITWTFDPLVGRNAYFNLQRLGASIVAYEPDFYGSMTDGVNNGDESDRCVVSWALRSDEADAAAVAGLPAVDVDGLRADGAAVLLSEVDGVPVIASLPAGATVALAQVPEDIVALRRRDQALALTWRRALRESLGHAIGAGFVASAMSRSGWYVLTKPEG